jgi:hypothetical protein
MDTINVDTSNILLNGQPYPIGAVRPIYPSGPVDKNVSLLFPWWQYNILWRGDVTLLINGKTGHPFASVKDFEIFCNAYIFKP